MAVSLKNNFQLTYTSNQSLLVLILISIAVNLAFPGEVFFQSKYLLIFTSILTSHIVFLREARANGVDRLVRRIVSAFVPLLFLALSNLSSINSSRSQEVLWLLFSYVLLLLTMRLIDIRPVQILSCILVITFVAFFIDLFCFYQYFFGFADLKQQIVRLTNLDESFKGALLARIGSRRVFANFPLPNTLAGFLAMVLPLQLFLIHLAIRTDKTFLPDSSKFMNKLFQHRWVLIFLHCQFSLSILSLLMTQSFGGWVCFSAVFLLLGNFLLKRWKVPLSSIGLALLLLLIVAALWITWIAHLRGFQLWNINAPGNPIGLRWIN